MLVSAIIPAYNEENTIANVILPLTKIKEINEVLVVSDGSTDRTAEIARNLGVKVIESAINMGKGGAMMLGLKEAQGDIILFLDADLIGLTENHIQQLLAPILNGGTEMVIGIFEHGRLATDLAQLVAPFLSGQRVVRKSLLERVDNLKMARFGVELELTKYVAEHSIKYTEVVLKELSHVMKEEKLGLVKGLQARMKMYWEIAKSLSIDE
ncbi:MAG: glycosyltransferase family 2 protein [Bacillota bacterium]